MKLDFAKFNKPVLLLTAFLLMVPALVNAADTPPDNTGIVPSTNLSLQISTLPEAKLSATQAFTFPFLRGTSALTSGNNIRTEISAEVTPVSLAGLARVIWTPIAFLELDGGGRLGTGWNMPLGNGIGLNQSVGVYSGTARKAEINGDPFDGAQLSAWFGGAFQFDLAAVVPGDWNHVIVRAYDELKYSAYTRAGKNDSWIVENDDGQNLNGWTWHGEAVIGYQMPQSPVLDFVGIMGELNYNLYDIANKEDWGGNLGRWIFSGLFNFSITPRFSTTLIVQMRTRNNYGTSDLNNSGSLWYQDQALSNDYGSQRLMFYRAALSFSYKIF
ncbi:MAG: hypothetical protein FWD78_08565 [Treponema sp.]|nr:hypothetical protein [Treponema sp.]